MFMVVLLNNATIHTHSWKELDIKGKVVKEWI